MAGDAFKAKLARVEALRSVEDEDTLVSGLRRALNDRSNYVIAKAAVIAGERYVTAVVPDLVAAYHRLFEDALKRDPLVLGKRAAAGALKALDYADASVYLRGLQYIQREPVWGGYEDHAGELRATCAHALVACDVESRDLLDILIEHLVDPAKEVRAEIVRAIGQSGGHESVLLLRTKALIGDTEPEVIGACLSALLEREPRESVGFVERFLYAKDDALVLEAATVLAASRSADAHAIIHRFWETELSLDVRRTIVFSSAASPVAAAGEFLLTIVSDRRADLAVTALTALAASRFRNELRERARQAALATGEIRIKEACDLAFGP